MDRQDSDLEALSHNSLYDSFMALLARAAVFVNCPNLRFLLYHQHCVSFVCLCV